MSEQALPDSFWPDDSRTVTAPNGALARRELMAHGALFVVWPALRVGPGGKSPTPLVIA